MTFLKTVLQDLDKIKIEHEEHYDPGGLQLFVIYVRDEANPTLTYSQYNPNQILLSIFMIHAPPHLGELRYRDKIHIETSLKQLGIQTGMLHKIGIQQNVFHASIGILLNQHEYDVKQLKKGMKIVMKAYDDFIGRAIDILYQ